MRWEILSKKSKNIIKTLLKNRGIKSEKEFFNPRYPGKIMANSLGLSKTQIKKAIERIKQAKKNKEKVIVYGDYDADGICATAIVWEALFALGIDALPYIPERFSEGYGLNASSISKLKTQDPKLKLIVTVDNGIVAYEGIKKAKELGIDVIIVDHHQPGNKKLNSYSVIHNSKVCGSALAYFFAKQLGKTDGLELAAIGTIADQMPLAGVNRSIVKYGLGELNKTVRPGLLALFEISAITKVGTYEINYMIAPRINAMGRISHGFDSLRLLCTKDKIKALGLARHLDEVNRERQRIVEKVVVHARGKVKDEKIIILSHESYHEGVIGLAASRLVEEFYRPAIVLSRKKGISKASARSISGFNIIEAIRQLEDLYLEGGGHPMAAGFSIETKKIGEFSKRMGKIAKGLLTEEILAKKLKIDLELNFEEINPELVERIRQFEPFGLGNPTPTFMSREVELLNARTVGKDLSHLKLRLRLNAVVMDAIYFGGGGFYSKLTPGTKIDLAYQLEENVWNNNKSLQLKVKDLHLLD